MNLPRRNKIVLLLTLSLVFSYSVAFLAGETLFVSAQSTSVSPPTFSPPGGTYSSPQSVVLACDTPDSAIRYTIDGSEPSDTSPLYRNPILVSGSTTIKAKGYVLLVSGMFRSDTSSATYTISAVEKVATPTFSPAGGSYSEAQSVVIQCATSGATIRYTVSGDEPSSSSPVYSESISVSANTTIKAKAFLTGMDDSNTASATYTIIIEDTDTKDPSSDNTAIYVAIAVVAIIAVVGVGIVYSRRRKK